MCDSLSMGGASDDHPDALSGARAAFEDSDAVPAQALAAARRAAVQGDLAAVLESELRRREAEVLFTELEMPVAATLAEMEDASIAVDETVLVAHETELEKSVFSESC